MQQVKIFDGYGHLPNLEGKINAWLNAEPRKILSVQATDLRLFIRWRPARDLQRRPAYFKLFHTLENGLAEAHFKEFFSEHPNIEVIFEAVNGSFIFWFWADET